MHALSLSGCCVCKTSALVSVKVCCVFETCAHELVKCRQVLARQQTAGFRSAARLAGWAAVECGERDVELPRVQLLVRREAVLQRRLVAGGHRHAVRLRTIRAETTLGTDFSMSATTTGPELWVRTGQQTLAACGCCGSSATQRLNYGTHQYMLAATGSIGHRATMRCEIAITLSTGSRGNFTTDRYAPLLRSSGRRC